LPIPGGTLTRRARGDPPPPWRSSNDCGSCPGGGRAAPGPPPPPGRGCPRGRSPSETSYQLIRAPQPLEPVPPWAACRAERDAPTTLVPPPRGTTATPAEDAARSTSPPPRALREAHRVRERRDPSRPQRDEVGERVPARMRSRTPGSAAVATRSGQGTRPPAPRSRPHSRPAGGHRPDRAREPRPRGLRHREPLAHEAHPFQRRSGIVRDAAQVDGCSHGKRHGRRRCSPPAVSTPASYFVSPDPEGATELHRLLFHPFVTSAMPRSSCGSRRR